MKLPIIIASVLFALVLAFFVAPFQWQFILLAIFILGRIPVLGVWLGFMLWCLFIAIKQFRRKAFLAGVICIAVPLAAPIAAYEVGPYLRYPEDYVFFQAMRRSYDDRIAHLPKNGNRYAEFNWGGMTFLSRGVAYDETDEIALPYGRQSAAWRQRMSGTDLTCGGNGPIGQVIPMGDHYYITSFGC